MKYAFFLALISLSSTIFCADGDQGPSRFRASEETTSSDTRAATGEAVPYREERFYKHHLNILQFSSDMTKEEFEEESKKLDEYEEREVGKDAIDLSKHPEFARNISLSALCSALTPAFAETADPSGKIYADMLFNTFKGLYIPKSLHVDMDFNETTITFLQKHPFYTKALQEKDSKWRTSTLEEYADKSGIEITRNVGAKTPETTIYFTPNMRLEFIKEYIDAVKTGKIITHYTTGSSTTKTFTPHQQNALKLVCAILISDTYHKPYKSIDFFKAFRETESEVCSLGYLERGIFTITIKPGKSKASVSDPAPPTI
ncbi:hypothetical protein EBQ93_02805 [bacterium]|nr:hypothetical protein [bacterium]